jgi:hypothetical protein
MVLILLERVPRVSTMLRGFEEVQVVSTTGLARQWGFNCWIDGGEGKKLCR